MENHNQTRAPETLHYQPSTFFPPIKQEPTTQPQHQATHNTLSLPTWVQQPMPQNQVHLVGAMNHQQAYNTVIDPREVINLRDIECDGIETSLFTIGASKTDWTDDVIRSSYPGLALEIYDDGGLVDLAEYCYNQLTTKETESVVAGLVSIAWNLRNTSNFLPIFPFEDPAEDPARSPNDVSYFTLDKTLEVTWRSTPDQAALISSRSTTTSQKACGYAYYSASLLRMVTKDVDTYKKNETRIRENFIKFYRFPFPINNIGLPDAALIFIHSFLNRNSILRNSMKSFLFIHNEPGVLDIGLRRYLYEQHLAYTGMKVFSLFVKIVSALSCEPKQLLMALNNGNTCKSILEIIKALKGPAKSTVTWKYARLFDPSYFRHLQTKNALPLVNILAELLEIAGGSMGKPTDMVQLSSLSTAAREEHKKIAMRIYFYITKKIDQ